MSHFNTLKHIKRERGNQIQGNFSTNVYLLVCSYNPVRGNCIKQIEAGKPCEGLGTCVTNSECTSSTQGVCTCNENFLQLNGVCVPLKEVGQLCTGEEECTPNSACAETCRCRPGFYKDKGMCNEKKNVGEVCSFDDMCKQYAICSSEVSGLCRCMDGFFNQGGLCGGRKYTFLSLATFHCISMHPYNHGIRDNFQCTPPPFIVHRDQHHSTISNNKNQVQIPSIS